MTTGIIDLIALEHKRKRLDIVIGTVFAVVTVIGVVLGTRFVVVPAIMAGIFFGGVIFRNRIILYMNIVSIQEAVVEYLLTTDAVGQSFARSDALDKIKSTRDLLSDGIGGMKGRKN